MGAASQGGSRGKVRDADPLHRRGRSRLQGFHERIEHARKGAAELDVTIDAFYLTLGEYDAVVVFDAPDARTAAKLSLINASNGRVRAVTMPAFTEDETTAISNELPA